MQFFEKMKDKVVPAAQKLKEGVGEKIQETRLKSQLKALLKEKQDKLLALGVKAYTLHRGEGIGIDDLAVELAELDELETRLEVKRAELESHGLHSPEDEPPENPPAPEPEREQQRVPPQPDYQ